MSKNIFSIEYSDYCDRLKRASNDYNVLSNDINKNKLESLRLQEWSDEKRFTNEYLIEYSKQRQKRVLSFEEEFNWLMRSVKIDDKALNGQIDEIQRAYLHNRNDNARDKLEREITNT